MPITSVYSSEAIELLEANISSYLIDVRTNVEWQEIGTPLIANNKNYLQLSWQNAPDMSKNQNFELELMTLITDKNSMLFFLCRSGFRSLEAAISIKNKGYMNCYNILDGFEGKNSQNGWKNNNLPFKLKGAICAAK
jgi:rhodanese-related sulfurtransferase